MSKLITMGARESVLQKLTRIKNQEWLQKEAQKRSVEEDKRQQAEREKRVKLEAEANKRRKQIADDLYEKYASEYYTMQAYLKKRSEHCFNLFRAHYGLAHSALNQLSDDERREAYLAAYEEVGSKGVVLFIGIFSRMQAYNVLRKMVEFFGQYGMSVRDFFNDKLFFVEKVAVIYEKIKDKYREQAREKGVMQEFQLLVGRKYMPSKASDTQFSVQQLWVPSSSVNEFSPPIKINIPFHPSNPDYRMGGY